MKYFIHLLLVNTDKCDVFCMDIFTFMELLLCFYGTLAALRLIPYVSGEINGLLWREVFNQTVLLSIH